MAKKNEESKNEQTLPDVCRAVKRVRQALGDTQQEFAQRIGVAVMTISNFETGRAEPRDPHVLENLLRAARDATEMGGNLEMGEVKQMIKNVTGTGARVEVMTLRGAEGLLRGAWTQARQANRHISQLESIAPPAYRSIQAFQSMNEYFHSLREWRLLFAARLAALYFPEQVAAIEKAAAPAIAIIDDVLSRADEQQIDYARFEREVLVLAERQALSQFKVSNTTPERI
jgi:transcriptional regulator with XRE-family HTH domain